VNIACVMFIMWFWHNTNVGIAYWVISKTCNVYLVFQFIIVLNVGIAYWVINITC
jgi:hypothetical protein